MRSPGCVAAAMGHEQPIAEIGLSMVTCPRVLRVARTIADLAGAEKVGRIHVAEALSYRRQAPRS
jgi:magnesium chelatase family protein